ncbi:MAG: VWA domain-containing protein [Acidobacteria bacterium]|nr:VWA domain-containing protein [Acidobacteriota bacterium]
MMRGRIGLVMLAVGLAVLPGRAQQDGGADVRFRMRTSVELVMIPVTVKDSAGNLVIGIERDEFRLFEDGVEQTIRYFSIDPFPLSVIILVDTGLSRGAQAAVRKALPVFTSAFGPEDEFALYLFHTYARRVLGFSRDRDKLHAAFRALEWMRAPARGGSTGGPMTAGPRINSIPIGPQVPSVSPRSEKPTKAIHDALWTAGLALHDRERGRRRVVFIISDGANSRLNQYSFKETRDLLLRENVSVYAIGVGNARFALGTTVLSDYARVTGGDMYAPLGRDGLARMYARVAEQARNQYTLVYAPPPARAGRKFRNIEVRVRRPGVTLLTYDGYFAGIPTE